MDGIPWRLRLRLRTLLVLVAVAALVLAVVSEYRSPARRWRRALRDDSDRRSKFFMDGAFGITPGIHRDFALAELLDALNDRHAPVRRRAIEGLRLMRPPAIEAVPVLAGLVGREPHDDTRFRIVMALGDILQRSDSTGARSAARPALNAALNDRLNKVRVGAAGALLQMGDDAAALPVLIEALGNTRRAGNRQRPDATSVALTALQKVGERARPAVPALLEVVGDFSPPMSEVHRLRAAGLLVRIGEEEAARRLLNDAARDGDASIRKAATNILISPHFNPPDRSPVAVSPTPGGAGRLR